MPRQNRVTPYGDVIAVAARGTLMGNRGNLDHGDGALRFRDSSTRSWISCSLDYTGESSARKGTNVYTKLFFLDEATALAAGHRPCFRCRRERGEAFRAAWNRGNKATRVDTMAELDRALHEARVEPGFRQGSGRRAYRADPFSLPPGAMVEHGGAPHLVAADGLLPWQPDGYRERVEMPGSEVWVITPRPTVRALDAGYDAQLPPTAS